MSVQLILGHFCPFLMVFRQNYQKSQSFSSKLWFLSFWILLYLSGSKFCPGDNFQFSANFHEYTLNMTSYHVTEAINGIFGTEI